jgi:hypothetical protein
MNTSCTRCFTMIPAINADTAHRICWLPGETVSKRVFIDADGQSLPDPDGICQRTPQPSSPARAGSATQRPRNRAFERLDPHRHQRRRQRDAADPRRPSLRPPLCRLYAARRKFPERPSATPPASGPSPCGSPPSRLPAPSSSRQPRSATTPSAAARRGGPWALPARPVATLMDPAVAMMLLDRG